MPLQSVNIVATKPGLPQTVKICRNCGFFSVFAASTTETDQRRTRTGDLQVVLESVMVNKGLVRYFDQRHSDLRRHPFGPPLSVDQGHGNSGGEQDDIAAQHPLRQFKSRSRHFV